MATITGAVNEKIFTINRWLGLNQIEDGDTQLKMGEAANAWNWRITKDGHLQKRPGSLTVVDLEKAFPIKGLWSGYVNKIHVLLGACDGKLYSFRSNAGEWQSVELGSVDTTGGVHIFGFSEKRTSLQTTNTRCGTGRRLRTLRAMCRWCAFPLPRKAEARTWRTSTA